jgi:NADH:ubiquinone oxidoreductase subunit 6 (subunit J)
MAWKIGMNKKVNISRVVTKIVVTVLALYVGGTILNAIGLVVENTTSPLYGGLSLIGWTVSAANKITATQTGTGGILTVIGIVGIASVIMEFVVLKMN